MGMYDTVYVPCPRCGTKHEAQSKGGYCRLGEYQLMEAPADVLSDVNRHAPFSCQKCGALFQVHLTVIATPVLATYPFPDDPDEH